MKTNTVSQTQPQAASHTDSRTNTRLTPPTNPSYPHQPRSTIASPTSIVLPPPHKACTLSQQSRPLPVLARPVGLTFSPNPVVVPQLQLQLASPRSTPLPQATLCHGSTVEAVAFFLLTLASGFGLVQNSSAFNSLPHTLHQLSDALRLLLP